MTASVDVPECLADPAVALARRWLAAAQSGSGGGSAAERRATRRLAALVADPAGLELAVRFVDRVARPEDRAVAARELGRLSTSAAGFLGPGDRALLAAGARLARVAPGLVVPGARLRLRQLVGHLVGDADGRRFAGQLARSRAQGYTVNVNLLGEAVLGEREARRRAKRLTALIRRPDVDYVSVKPSALASHLSTWDLPGSRDRLVERLLPLARAAAECDVFLNLDMEEYRDLALTVSVFESVLAEPGMDRLRAGIVLQAYLPDALEALERLTEEALHRAAGGGRPVKVRFVKGANLAMEKVEAELHGWHQAPYGSKPEVDANYVRLLDTALHPERTGAVRVGLASHNLFDVAFGHLLAESRGVGAALDVEMLQGMAPAQARAVAADVGRVVLYAPVVARDDFDVAVAYLIRRLEENSGSANFLHALFADGNLDAQEAAFRASVADRATPGATSRRLTLPTSPTGGFHNVPDTDPAVAAHRAWAAQALASEPGPPRTPVLTSGQAVDRVVAAGREAGAAWRTTAVTERAELLERIGVRLVERRSALLAVMAHEAGKTVAEADPEISEAIDFANWYAQSARELAQVRGATFTPARLVLVTPPWNFPVAIPLGGALAGLAAGAPVLLKPASQVPRCAEVAVEAVHQAMDDTGVDRRLLQVVRVEENDVGRHLVAHPDVDRIVLTGALETARSFATWAPATTLLAETSGKNAIVVTPSADVDLAVADIVHAAFGHAGQKCSATSLVICVGSVAGSERFRRQLVDATASLRVGAATDLGTDVGPLIEEPQDKLLRGLTVLDAGERWLVQPRRLGPALWTPGIRDGVAAGSWFHRTECFGPVLGLMRAADLDEAVRLQNATAYGLTGGLHALDEDEIDHWLARVEVGNAYVNKATTGAIVRRQPFGGWKASSVGPGAKAGGPHYVAQLGSWTDAPEVAPDWGAWAAADDHRAWHQHFATGHDDTGLTVESNVLRYRPVPHLHIRAGSAADPAHVARVRSAARTAGVPVTLSEAADESDAAYASRVAAGEVVGRIRVVGAAPGLRAAAAGRVGEVTVLDAPVVAAAERELLTVLREQSISRTRHRFGHLPPDR